MSAGTGIRHSEYNKNNNTPAEFLQIWVIPDRMNVSPRYENAVIADLLKKNEITEIVSPYPGDGKGLWIYQQAWFSIGELEKNTLQGYKLKQPKSLGVYAFLIEGKATVAGKELEKRDGLGIYDTESFEIKANEYTKILLIEVPPYS